MNDTALNNVTLELTQKIQMHFPRDINPSTFAFWNGQPKEVISAKLLDAFGRIPEEPVSERVPQDPLSMSIIVDCDANPNIPSGLYLTGEGTEHRKMGKITLEKRDDGKLYANGKEVVRDLSPNQKNGKTIQGHKLRKELKDVQVLNACIMDALLANPQLIPDEWKIRLHLFLGNHLPRRVRHPVRRVPVLERRQVVLELPLARQRLGLQQPGCVARKLVLGTGAVITF